jgi:hypothetical protein
MTYALAAGGTTHPRSPESQGQTQSPETRRRRQRRNVIWWGPRNVTQQQAVESVAHLQSMTDNMVIASHMKGSLSFDMLFLLRCLILSGFLNDAHQLKEAVLHSLPLAVADASMCAYFQSMANETHAVPSGTTLYRHRLTVHIALCRWLAKRTGDMLANGVCR